MSISGLDKIPNRTSEQAREEIARKDRASWFSAVHASGEYGIVSRRSGREVARCTNPIERDEILLIAHNFDRMREALTWIADNGELNCGEAAKRGLGDLYQAPNDLALAGAGGLK